MKFISVVRGRNCGKYIDQCIHSIVSQDVDWGIHIILDPSKDDSWERASKYQSNRIKVTLNEKRQGVGRNMYFGIRDSGAEPEDVICIVDADDYLLPDALRKVKKVYDEKHCLVTYGSFILDCTGAKSRICKPYEAGEKVRKAKWKGTHLKTFKRKVFDNIPFEYLDVSAASDLALMFGVMESAGIGNCEHISKPLYHYRNKVANSVNRDKQKAYEKTIRKMKCLKKQF